MEERVRQYLCFIQEAEKLKSVTRTAWTAQGRRESTAEHSWRLALLAGALSEEYPSLDRERVLLMCLLHDIGEADGGDISAASRPDPDEKLVEERRTADRLFSLLPAAAGERFMDIWEEYNEAATPEAKLVKALDKAETILQHSQGDNPEGFDYEFNLTYGSRYFKEDDCLREIRRVLDQETRRRRGETR